VYSDYGPDDWMRLARRRYTFSADGEIRLDYDPSIARTFNSPATTPQLWPFFCDCESYPSCSSVVPSPTFSRRDTVEHMQAAVPSLRAVEIRNGPRTIVGRAGGRMARSMPSCADCRRACQSEQRAARAFSARLFRPHAVRLGVR